MGVPLQHCHNTKRSGVPSQDQDSSSTQSTCQSHSEVASLKESNNCGQDVFSGYSETQVRPAGGLKKSLSIASQELVFPSQIDFSHSMAPIPFHCAEPYFGGIFAPCASQAMFHHPQIMGIAPGRVPLPLDFSEEEPIYVNAKQYRAIVRRRQFRAKLEAQNKLIKVRKPYLHESRHVHALKRARGSGGRFLNMKKLQDSKHSTTATATGHRVEVSGSDQLHLAGNNMLDSDVHETDNYRDGASTTSCLTSLVPPTVTTSFHDRISGSPATPLTLAGHCKLRYLMCVVAETSTIYPSSAEHSTQQSMFRHTTVGERGC